MEGLRVHYFSLFLLAFSPGPTQIIRIVTDTKAYTQRGGGGGGPTRPKGRPFMRNACWSLNYRFTQVGDFLALTWPCFFLSTLLGSRVTQPARG